MIRQLWAAWLLALILSPFTAPFQTCVIADVPSGHADEAITPPPSTAATLAYDDSLLEPFNSERGRLKLAPVSDLAIFLVAPAVAPVAPPVEPARDTGEYSIQPSVLRL